MSLIAPFLEKNYHGFWRSKLKNKSKNPMKLNFFFNNFHKHTPSNKKKIVNLKTKKQSQNQKKPQNPQYSMYFYFYSLHLFTLILGQFSHGCPVFRCPPVRPKCARPRYYLHNGRICRHCDRNICPRQSLKGR